MPATSPPDERVVGWIGSPVPAESYSEAFHADRVSLGIGHTASEVKRVKGSGS